MAVRVVRVVRQRAKPKPPYVRPHGVKLCGFCVTNDCDLCPGQVRNGYGNKKVPVWTCPCYARDPGRHPKAALLNLEDNGGARARFESPPVSTDRRRRGKRMNP
jgi:hypothetical protein